MLFKLFSSPPPSETLPWINKLDYVQKVQEPLKSENLWLAFKQGTITSLLKQRLIQDSVV